MDIWNIGKSTVRNIPRVLHGSLFLRCGLFSKVYEYPYHAWQPTQRSPRRRKYQIIPRLSVQSYEPPHSALPGTLSSRLYCTGRYDGYSSIRYAGYAARTHLRPSLHCAALHCTHCMKESPFGDASLSPRYLQISPFPPSHLLGTTRYVSG